MAIASVLAIAAALFAFLFSTPVQQSAHSKPTTSGTSFECPKHSLFLTAHPDDECMFFGPTIISLVSSGCQVSALCLSKGDSDGIGELRAQELYASYSRLGVNASHVTLIDHPDLQDSIARYWEPTLVSSILRNHTERLGIDTVLTFDSAGISGHPNHISLLNGALHLASQLPEGRIAIYSLRTNPVLSKYSGILWPTYHRIMWMMNSGSQVPIHRFISSLRGYATAYAAMQAHWSQLVWFRWLYILNSQYMWMNEWTEI
ncbi:N-acetylglucosaminylphosphatidylinositoldeacety la se [Clavulina sp. PMI_390]|nr:N-acetylglucosaminylphosphatidylinositoldeacety la se [Clavulina sp. PMI_390]